MKKLLLLTAALALFAVSAQAYYLGNPGLSTRKGASSVEFVYDTGEREMKPSGGSQTVDVESRRMYIQWRHGISKSFQVVGRLLPGLGRVDWENSDFNPALWGFGAAIQFSPREKLGLLRVGALAGYNINYGKSSGDEITWKEGNVAFGLSYDPTRETRVYGGISIIVPDVEIEYENGTKQDWEADTTWGPFFGGNLILKPAWVLAAEVHLMNEDSIALYARYRF